MENPNFIQSNLTLMKEKNTENVLSIKEPEKFLKDNFKEDINLLLDNLENGNNKEERIEARI